jgi:hypothetical protein
LFICIFFGEDGGGIAGKPLFWCLFVFIWWDGGVRGWGREGDV